jgi:hypothetical protein
MCSFQHFLGFPGPHFLRIYANLVVTDVTVPILNLSQSDYCILLYISVCFCPLFFAVFPSEKVHFFRYDKTAMCSGDHEDGRSGMDHDV